MAQVEGYIGTGSGTDAGLASTAVASAIQGIANYFTQERTNKANRELAEYGYSMDLDQWNRMNEYNSPLNQMLRFKEAGLNPNLIYGQGTPGNATSSPTYKAPHLQAPQLDALGQIIPAIQTYANVKQQAAQTDNLRKQNDLIVAQAVTEGMKAGEIGVRTAQTDFDLNLAKELRTNSLDVARQNLANMRLDQHLKGVDIQTKTAELPLVGKRGSLMDAQQRNLQLDNAVKQLQLILSERGITTSDNVLLRMATKFFHDAGVSTNIGDYIK